jgi:hypothetical protein
MGGLFATGNGIATTFQFCFVRQFRCRRFCDARAPTVHPILLPFNPVGAASHVRLVDDC